MLQKERYYISIAKAVSINAIITLFWEIIELHIDPL